MTIKTFLPIPAYPNYEVSHNGTVRNIKTGNNLKWVDNGKGYKVVKLYNDSRPQGRLCLVHRLVLSTWLPTDDFSLDVNHIDGNKSNNCVVNLQWVTKSENTRHAHITGLFKNKLTIDQIKEIKQIKLQIERETQQQIADKYGISRSIVGKIWSGDLYDYV